jgi:hypothetical protein
MPAAWRKDRLLRSMTEPLERRYRTIPNVFDVLLHRSCFTPRFLQATAKAPDIGAIARRRSTKPKARRTSTACCTSTRGCGSRRPPDQGATARR